MEGSATNGIFKYLEKWMFLYTKVLLTNPTENSPSYVATLYVQERQNNAILAYRKTLSNLLFYPDCINNTFLKNNNSEKVPKRRINVC